MALDTLIAGRFSATYNSVDVGITDEGYELEQESKAEVIDKSDHYGDSIIDFIYRGGNAYMQFNSKAYKAGSKTPFWPWGNFGVMKTNAAPIGRLASAVAAAFVLTATAATPAAATPATLTITTAILAPNITQKLLYNSKLRHVPIRLIAIPGETTGTVTWWTET